MTDTRDVIIESIHTLFADTETPTPDQVADALIKGLGLEQEWGVAYYDEHGDFSEVRNHDYEFDTVHRQFMQIRENYPLSVGGWGMVTRFFTHWSKV